MDSICVAAAFVISFGLALFSYRRGLADGIRIKEGKPVEKTRKPKKEQATNIKEPSTWSHNKAQKTNTKLEWFRIHT